MPAGPVVVSFWAGGASSKSPRRFRVILGGVDAHGTSDRAGAVVGGGTFLVNGRRQPYLRTSGHEADRAGRLLSAACGFPVQVTGVVVPVGADDLTIKTPPRDVHVVSRMRLRRWLTDRPHTVDQAFVGAVYTAARKQDTWRGNPLRATKGD